MRTIDELGISKTPWILGSLIITSDGLLARSSVDDYDDGVVAGDLLIKEEDTTRQLVDSLNKELDAWRKKASVLENERDELKAKLATEWRR